MTIIFAIYNDVCSTKNIQKISYYGRYDAAPRAVGLKRENREQINLDCFQSHFSVVPFVDSFYQLNIIVDNSKAHHVLNVQKY